MSLTAVAALVDRRRADAHSDTVARRLAESGCLRLTVLEVPDESRPFHASERGGRATYIQIPADRVGPAVTAHLQGRDGALLVVDAHGGGRPGDVLFDDDVEYILERLPRPVLVLGPDAGQVQVPTRLVIPLDRSGLAAASSTAVTSWLERFPASTVSLLALDAPDSWPDSGRPPPPDDADEVHAILRDAGVVVELHRTDGSNPVAAVLDASDPSSIIVVAAGRWASGPGHWFATARDLIRHARRPVLVVPAEGTDHR